MKSENKKRGGLLFEFLHSSAIFQIGVVLILAALVLYAIHKIFGKGGVFDTFWTWAGQAAEQAGFASATAALKPQLDYISARSAAIKAHGMTFQTYKAAYYAQWPTKDQWLAGVPFP